MIYWELFIGFLQVGLFSFGGAYGAIPLIRDVVQSYGWLTEDELTYMIAISESTPGPIMVNLATYVGSDQGGLAGSILATLSVVLPAFLIILLISALMKTATQNKYVQAILGGLKPCIIGIILATGISMVLTHMKSASAIDLPSVIITLVLGALMLVWPKFRKKKLSPIMLILFAAACGIVGYGL